ncbi:MAG: Na+/proline symporter [Motiliproteus sp.]|jgi:Na+/proline symporter
MFTASTVIAAIIVYMAVLFIIALLVERKHANRVRPHTSRLVYALAITVYCTSWTFYGSVEFAARSGGLFFAIYIGAILAILAWWKLLRPMVRIKKAYNITSIADFISARYNRSQLVAALVTLIALIGIVPYTALQLKAVTQSFTVITAAAANSDISQLTGLLVPLIMIAFTLLFGARKLDSTERHLGVMTILAVQGVIKLAAFIAVGLFVTYGMYDGFNDILARIQDAGLTRLTRIELSTGSNSLHALTLVVLGAVSIQCLPRQFHAAVVENARERHILTAMWVVPLYLILIGIFVIPIAAAGLLQDLPSSNADIFILLLPQLAGADWLSLVAFIGGFSAATGMIILSAMTLSTMATNHLLMVLIDHIKPLNFLRGYLLQCRWVMIALIIGSGYWFSVTFSDAYMLVAMGMISFVAVFQFAPVMFGGLFWKRGNRAGAIAGLGAGFLLWFYTLVLPAFAGHGLPLELLSQGPWGIDWLRPQQLFGLDGLSPVSHSALWSLLFNLGFYLLGSLLHKPSKLERHQRSEFMATLIAGSIQHNGRATGLDAYIVSTDKIDEAIRLLQGYLPDDKAKACVLQITEELRIDGKEQLTIIELLEFHRTLEHALAGSIGAAGAHQALVKAIRYSERETLDFHAIQRQIQHELQDQPENATLEDSLYGGGSIPSVISKLQNQISQLQQSEAAQQRLLEKFQQRLDKSEEKLFEQRITNQRQLQDLEELRLQLKH